MLYAEQSIKITHTNDKPLLPDGFECMFYTTHMDDSTRKKLEKLTIKNIIILNDNDEVIFED